MLAAIADIAEHPEITLSRRDIVRFILIEPTKRSEEIQSLLKLDDIGLTRSALNTAQNKLRSAHDAAAAQVRSTRDNLVRHLQISALISGDILQAINVRRKILGLAEIGTLTSDAKFDAGLSDSATAPDFNKISVLRDLKALSEAEKGFASLARSEAASKVDPSVKTNFGPQ